MVFNDDMDNLIETKQLISKLGGATEVAKMLNFDLKKGGAQRVHNWMKRGIPAQVKVDHPHLFLKIK